MSDRRLSSRLTFLFGVVAAYWAAVSPAIAQTETGTPENGTAGAGTPSGPPDGDGSADGGFMSLDPGDWVKDAFSDFAEAFTEGIYQFVDGVNTALFGVPALGDPREMPTWTEPTGPFWPAVWETYWTLAFLSLVGLIVVAMRAHSSTSGRELKVRLADVAFSAGMILFGWWIAQFALHLGNSVAMGFAPDPETMFATPGSTAKVGLGVVVGAIALLINAGAVLTAFSVVLLERAVLLITVGLWPVFWLFRPTDGGLSNTVAGIGLGTFAGVLGAKMFQAILAHMVFNISWQSAHAADVVGAIIGTVIGTAVTFIGIPLMVGRNFIPEAMTMLGTPAVSVATDFSEKGGERVREKGREAVQNYGDSGRGESSGRGGRVPRSAPSSGSASRSVGSVGGAAPAASSTPTTDTPPSSNSSRRERQVDSHLRRRDSLRSLRDKNDDRDHNFRSP